MTSILTHHFSKLQKFLFIPIFLLIGVSSCSDKCRNDDPRARITNYGTNQASVQIKTSGGNTENINNIEVGETSDWRSYAAGLTEFTLVIQNTTDDTLIIVPMENCFEYDILIDSLNQVSSRPQERL